MTTPSDAVPDLPDDTPGTAAAVTSATRPLYWSVRRELWENRYIYLAPLSVAAVVLFGFSIRALFLPQRMRTLSALEPARQHAVVVMPYSIAASMIILTGFIVGVFYCLDALYGERRDRSILFWKSLPVSDRTTVLAKAIVPFVVIPLIAFAISLATQLIMLLLNSAVLTVSGVGAGALWTRLPLFFMTLVMFYGLTVHALWYAPIYAWLILVSAWARRAPLLWAVLPLLAIGILEGIVSQTHRFAAWVGYRLIGAMRVAFALDKKDDDIVRFSQLDPARFLSTPGLWIGLIAAAALLAAAVRLRRNREPI
jgi:ABC-2 type transport system permease protein